MTLTLLVDLLKKSYCGPGDIMTVMCKYVCLLPKNPSVHLT